MNQILNRKIFYILISWFLFLFGSASILIFKTWIFYPNSLPIELPPEEYVYMSYWFSRNWFYSIIPLSILASIGLIKSMDYIKSKKLWNLKTCKKNLKLTFSLISASLIIYLSLSNTIISGIFWNNYDEAIFKDEEAQVIGWVGQNIPRGSNILVENSKMYTGLAVMAFCKTYYISEVFDGKLSIKQNIDRLKSKGIQYLILSKYNEAKYEMLVLNYYKIKLFEY